MSEDRTQQLPDDGVRLILSRLDSIDIRLTSLDERVAKLDGRVAKLDERITKLDERVAKLDERVTRLDERVTRLDERVTRLDERMIALEEKVDRRLQETRPIWEQVLARLGGIETRLETIEYEVADLNLKLRVFNQDLLKMQHRQDATEERLRRIKAESEP